MARDPGVWVLADERVGTANQALGVARAMGLPHEVKTLAYNGLATLPNLVLGRTLVHLRRRSAAAVAGPWPDVVIAAGRRTAPVARAIKRRSGGAAFLAQIMWPGPPVGGIDLIAAPAHDRLPEGGRFMATVGAPHCVTEEALGRARRAWAPRLGGLARPRVVLLVGGAARGNRFTPAMAGDLCRRAAGPVGRAGGTLTAVTSPRTGAELGRALRASLGPDAGIHFWRPDDADDPYLGHLAWADAVIVTGDSASMCTEACATGRPVYIFAPDGVAAARHRRLHAELFSRGVARPLDSLGNLGNLETWSGRPLDDAAAVAAEILRRSAARTDRGES